MNDGIAEFVSNFKYDNNISLSWMMYWSEGGRDPLNTAWQVSSNPIKMIEFLFLYDNNFYVKARKASIYYRVNNLHDNFARESDCIRLAVPKVITLNNLLERLKT